MKSEEKIFRNMKREFIMLCLGVVIAMFFVFLFSSCGARKVERKQIKEQTEKKQKIVTENDITATDNITITSKSFVIDSTKEIITTKTYKPMNPNLPATFTDSKGKKQELNNTEYTESEIKRNKALSETNNTNTQHDSKTQDNSKKTEQKEEQNKKDEEARQSERKPISIKVIIFSLLFILLVLLIIYWLYEKYKDKIPFI